MITEQVAKFGRTIVIYDASRFSECDPKWFDDAYYRAQGAVIHSTTGRGGVLLLERPEETWVLRHYHRGGFVAKLVYDHYLWTGRDRNRAFREWRLLAHLHALGLPAPRPIAARAVRVGPLYQADIVTRLIPDTQPLSSVIRAATVADEQWLRIGAMLRAFHRAGVDHPDLTAHNVLLGGGPSVFLVDFDNARLRPPGPWSRMGLARFERSLRKVALETGTEFDARAWQLVRRTYAESAR
ncbi:MAG TPA: 3-deoxy-D-manno-octulosonic acid kinase [Gammaproteobacteria bacterium]|jgi:3-deoxy-D-manno-octulosonic acid kinase